MISEHDKQDWLSISYKGVLSRVWQNTRFCDKNCDKFFPEKFRITNNTQLFRVKGERKALSKSSEICHENVMFQSLKSILSYLESFQNQIATQRFTFPWIPDFVDDCLVRLVYLIHEPNRTSDESFSFNPKNYLARIIDSTMLQIPDESGLKLILICA